MIVSVNAICIALEAKINIFVFSFFLVYNNLRPRMVFFWFACVSKFHYCRLMLLLQK